MEHVEQEQLRRFWRDIVSAAGPCDPAMAAALVVTHLLPDRPFFLDALDQVAEIACVLPKPKSIDRHVLLRIRDRYDIEVPDRDALADSKGFGAFISRRAIGDRSLVAIDIGGYFAPSVRQLAAKASLAGVVEDTENGHQRYVRELKAPFPCPVFSVARSPLKNAEDYLVGHSIVFSTEGLMRSRGDVLQGRTACVIGYGKIGRSIAQLLRAHGVQIAVHDIDPVPLTEAHAHGFAVHTAQLTDTGSAALPSICHADNTTRPQVLDDHACPTVSGILDALDVDGQHPVLLNTSFNGRCESLVNSQAGALETFARLDLDFLAMSELLFTSRGT